MKRKSHILSRRIIITFAAMSAIIGTPTGAQTVAGNTYEPLQKANVEKMDSATFDSLFIAEMERKMDLMQVEVVAQKPLVKNEVDRLSYDVKADKDNETKTLLDMLKKVPMVSVDAQDQIRVNGSTNFVIYHNGHPEPAIANNYKYVFKAIPASMVKRVEVITEPGAKYDAEGVGAILNIVTEETSAKVSAGPSGTIGAGIDTRADVNANFYLSSNIGKVATSINYGYHHVNSHGMEQSTASDFIYADSGNRNSSWSNSRAIVNVHYGNIAASYDFNKNNLLSVSFGGFMTDYSARTNLGSRLFDKDDNLIYGFDAFQHIPSTKYWNFNGRADFEHRTAREGETVTLSYMVSTTRNKSEVDQDFTQTYSLPYPYTGYVQKGDEKFLEHTFQIDWTRPFAKVFKFETGAKYVNRINKSHTTMTYDGFDEGNINSLFDHTTRVAAIYGNLSFNKDKWSARAGLRYEHSFLDARYPDGSQENYSKRLNDWVPSATVAYNISPANSLKLAFATRINRPGISYLNPAIRSTPMTVEYGNPHLASSRNYSISMTYMHISPRFTYNITPTYTFSNSQIGEINTIEDNRRVTTYGNVISQRQFSINAFMQWMITKKTSMMLNGNYSVRSFSSSVNNNLKLTRWDGVFVYANVTQELPLKIQATANIGTFGGGLESVYSRQGHMWFHGIGLQRSFLKEDRLTVKLNAQNPFVKRMRYFNSYVVNGDYTGINKMGFTMQQFELSATFRFGSSKVNVKKTSTTIENDDVVGGSKGASTSGAPSDK